MRDPMDLLAYLPGPFEWIYIPKGMIFLRYAIKDEKGNSIKEHAVVVEPFYIAKYVITNAQFAIYMHETGRIPRVSHVHHENFNQPLQPIVDLTWLEVMYFCEWITHKAGSLIMLPTAAQWQHAAQGDDHRKYPWGNEWDSSLCNTLDSRIGHTTPVTQFPQGRSPYGVMDMVGNVCEWTLTAETGANSLEFKSFESVACTEVRIFTSSHYTTSIASVDVTRHGASPIEFPYVTGIRLATAAVS